MRKARQYRQPAARSGLLCYSPLIPKKSSATAKTPIALFCYGGLLLIPVLCINIPYFMKGEWNFVSLFFFVFGSFICFAAIGGARKIRFRGHMFFSGVLLTLVAILWMLQPHYHVFPFFWTLFAFVFTGLEFLNKDKKRTANQGRRRRSLIFGSLFCVIGTFLSVEGVRNALQMYSLRHAPVSDVREIVFSHKESPLQIQLKSPEEIVRFQQGMGASYAFSKRKVKNSGNNNPWNVHFRWKDGRQTTFSIGSGSGYYPDAAFIEFRNHQYLYQSRTLYKMLQPLLWTEAGK